MATNIAIAQTSYHTFTIDEKVGITDNSSNEIIKPTFKYSDVIRDKNEIHLKNYSRDKPDVIFNTITGEQKEYESIHNNAVRIDGVQFSEIRTKNKNYLLSQESNLEIPLTRKYSSFLPTGQYILEKYSEYKYPKAKATPKPKVTPSKSGVPPPPPPPVAELPPVEIHYYGVITNDEKFQTFKRIVANNYLPLYKAPEEVESEDGIILVDLILINYGVEDDFDYIVFSDNSTHHLYDGKMKLIKTFTLANADDKALLAFAKKTVGTNMSLYSKNNPPPSVMAVPTMRGSMEAPEVKYPFFYTEKIADGFTLFALQLAKDNSKSILKVAAKSTYLDESKNRLGVKSAEGKWSYFSYDPQTCQIFLPQIYFSQLGIIMI